MWIVFAVLLQSDMMLARVETTLHHAEDQLSQEYNVKQFIKKTYQPSRQERTDLESPFHASVKRDKQGMEDAYQSLLKKFPDSPNVLADYIFFIDRKGRTQRALQLADEGATKFPDDLRLQIMRDHYKKLVTIRKKEDKEALKNELDRKLAAWRRILAQNNRSLD